MTGSIYFVGAQVHVTFGYGAHGCLGRNLALLEMRAALNLLLDRLPNMRFDPER